MSKLLVLVLLCAATVSAAPGQLQEFRLTGSVGHFDITSAPEFDARALAIGERAERAYDVVSSAVGHALSFRPLLVIFATRADQLRAIDTRTIPGNREHVLLTLDTPDSRLDGLLLHELSHVFLFDALAPSGHRNIPLWVLEGLAAHQRGEWEAADLELLRAMVESSTLPALSAAHLGRGEPSNAAVFGHAAFDFLTSRAGSAGLRRFFELLRQNPAANPAVAYVAAVGVSEADFDRAFRTYLQARL